MLEIHLTSETGRHHGGPISDSHDLGKHTLRIDQHGVLRTAQVVAPAEIVTTLYGRMADLPHFNLDDDRGEDAAPGRAPLHPIIAALRAEIAAAQAVLFSTPEYAGALPGSFKNLLDWTVGGGEIYCKPVAWVNASSAPTGASHAYASLATVLGFLRVDLVKAACTRIPVSHAHVGVDGLIADAGVREQIAGVLSTFVRYLSDRR